MNEDNNDWISMSDRMPDHGEDVLYCFMGKVYAGRFARDDDGWVFYGAHGFLNFMDVQYWMPTPEVPSDETTG